MTNDLRNTDFVKYGYMVEHRQRKLEWFMLGFIAGLLTFLTIAIVFRAVWSSMRETEIISPLGEGGQSFPIRK